MTRETAILHNDQVPNMSEPNHPPLTTSLPPAHGLNSSVAHVKTAPSEDGPFRLAGKDLSALHKLTTDFQFKLAIENNSPSSSGNYTSTDSPGSVVSLPGLLPSLPIAIGGALPNSPPTTPTDLESRSPSMPKLSPTFLDDIPVLETHIPDDLLPDELLVHDDDPLPLRYVRVEPHSLFLAPGAAPALARDPASPPKPAARLYLTAASRIAAPGAHARSSVFRAALSLPLPLHSCSPPPDSDSDDGGPFDETAYTTARVVAKTPGPACSAHAQLAREARLYDALPARLTERHTVLLNGAREPVAIVEHERGSQMVLEEDVVLVERHTARALLRRAATQKERAAAEAPPQKGLRKMLSGLVRRGKAGRAAVEGKAAVPGVPEGHTTFAFGAVAPKFFGYYLPLKQDGEIWWETHPGCTVEGGCEVRWPAPILLMEDCGEPVEHFLGELTLEQSLRSRSRRSAVFVLIVIVVLYRRKECFSLFKYLHDAGFANLSANPYDILVQPGPLGVPSAQRSLRAPSFRIVDFGRAEARASRRTNADEFEEFCNQDFEYAWSTLGLPADGEQL
ncbi:uncharacterized protein BXZ73DRAFT_79122 [Epithele typhae]|uniref:uncharacterized protein n=1 Tax=Epithele typhae TaxID=378194 RepID=UPI0020084D05|nr:uncharacterized protein BXZ73DRAFT_79122 [Epithele typhae]KAH9924993.1 hypothetical protein BXZ73DRAFT_79122 [Epithele typhae]